MTTVLYVKAHPFTGKESKTIEIADTFFSAYCANNPNDTIETLDLFNSYVPELDVTLLTAFGASAQGNALTDEQTKALTQFNALTEQFLAADKVVIANALWNLNVPTKLKAWFDAINVAGKTFKYTENGPVPLTEGKKVLHIQSSGGIYDGNDFSAQYVKGMLAFVGVTDHQPLVIEGIDHHPEQRDEIMAAVKVEAEKIAQTF